MIKYTITLAEDPLDAQPFNMDEFRNKSLNLLAIKNTPFFLFGAKTTNEDKILYHFYKHDKDFTDSFVDAIEIPTHASWWMDRYIKAEDIFEYKEWPKEAERFLLFNMDQVRGSY